MSTTDDALCQHIAAQCRPGQWAQQRPLLARLGEVAGAGPEAVVGWLQAATGGSSHEAAKALHAMTVHQWFVQETAAGALELHAGQHAWHLEPQTRYRPAAWRVLAAD